MSKEEHVQSFSQTLTKSSNSHRLNDDDLYALVEESLLALPSSVHSAIHENVPYFYDTLGSGQSYWIHPYSSQFTLMLESFQQINAEENSLPPYLTSYVNEDGIEVK